MPGSEPTTVQHPERAPSAARRPDAPALPAPYRRHQFRTVAAFALAVVILVPSLVSDQVTLTLVNTWLLYSVIAVGFYLVFAVAGQFAFSQAFMALLGGYLAAAVSQQVGFVLGTAFGMLVTAGVAALFALAMRKANHFYFAIATIGLSEIGILVFRNWTSLAGVDGVRTGIAPPTLFGLELGTGELAFFLILLVLTVTLLLTAAVERSPVRRELVALHGNEVVSETLGIPVLRLRVAVFVLGSALGALAGSLYAHWQGFISTEAFGINLGIGIFLMVLLGGSRSMWGAVVGAAFYVWVPEQFSSLAGYEDILFGGLILLVVVFVPDGLVGLKDLAVAALRRRGRQAGG